MKKPAFIFIIILLLTMFVACDETVIKESDASTNSNTEQTETPSNNDTTEPPKQATICEHIYGDWQTISEATCIREGTKERVCTLCPNKEQGVIEKAEHTIIIDNAVQATCSKTGLTEGSHCSVCNAVIVPQTITETIAHTIIIDKGIEATCTKEGLTEGSHCSVCNTTLINQEIIPASHKWQEATCESPKTCLVCHITDGEATGHWFTNQYTVGVCNICGMEIHLNIEYFSSNAFIKDTRAYGDVMFSRSTSEYLLNGTANLRYVYTTTISGISNSGIGDPSISYNVNLYKKDDSGEYVLYQQQTVVIGDCYVGKRKENAVLFSNLTSGEYKVIVENN